MNTRATFFHWLLLGVLAAIAITLLLVSKGLPGTLLKGDWPMDFLQETYLDAEKELLRTEVAATNIGREIAFTLAQQGGFSQAGESPCGAIGTINLWNVGGRSCFPDAVPTARTLAVQKLAQQLPQDHFTEIGFENGTFYGKGEIVQVVSANSKYSFRNHFAVLLNYYFEDYPLLFVDAQRMLSSCRDRADLQGCLLETKPVYWKFGSCSTDAFPENSRKVPFCVQSPLGSTFSLGTEMVPLWVDASYVLALDFSPSAPISVQDLDISWDSEMKQFTLRFSRDLSAQRYTVYYTNYPLPVASTGTAREVFGNVVEDFEFFKEQLPFRDQDLVLDPGACASTSVRIPATPYLCGNEVILEFGDGKGRFKERESYLFTITTFWNERESSVKGLTLVQT